MKKGIKKGIIIAAIALFVFIVLVILTCLGFRVEYDPNLGINWQATAAVGTIFGAFATTAVGAIALYLSWQANNLVRKQDEIARKERLLREVEKTVEDVNYILSLKFVFKGIRDTQDLKDDDIIKYCAEITLCRQTLKERQIDFHYKEIIDKEFKYYDYVFGKLKEFEDAMKSTNSLAEGIGTLRKLDSVGTTDYFKLGTIYIAHAEKNLFGEDHLYKHSA